MGLNLGDLTIVSSDFDNLAAIPSRCAKDGDDQSPNLRWSGAPEGTREFALICHDPDAPLPQGWTHWVLYGIPASVTELESGAGGKYVEGRSDYGEQGWGGPQPPPGHGVHHYYFWVYALDTELGAEPGLTRAQLLERIDGHVLEQARLVGTYEQ
jgi:Raf kinase inhibitor-like YbhB/YbcL family protein